MAIRSEKNLYPGINPHLNSALQQSEGDWQSFHAYHLINIAQLLNRQLPPAYYAKPEQSLQIKIYDPPLERTSKSRPDVLISRFDLPVEGHVQGLERSTPTLTLPLVEVVEELDEVTALVIYRGEKPITRIEVLSPANKVPGSHAALYVVKRAETLHSGLHVVEIDYLHERRPTVEALASYASGAAEAYPYHIIVFDAQPSFDEGQTYFYGFNVFSPLPLVKIPLMGDEAVEFDFGEVYSLTFSERPFYSTVDYALEPINFAAYSESDQQAIRSHMAKIAAGEITG